MSEKLAVKVKPLEWHKSNIIGWNGDYHTLPTAYTVRCADENGWRWQGLGAHGYRHSPEAAMADAQAYHDARILAALEPSPDPRLAMAREALTATRADFEAWAKIRGGIGTYQGAMDRIDAALTALEDAS